ncbi:hypothetical protein ACPV5R_18130 [Vibrio astriarenae]
MTRMILILTSLYSVSCFSNIVLPDMSIVVDGPISVNNIMNVSETDSSFIKVNVSKLIADDNGKYQETPLEDPTELIVSPNRMIIPSGGGTVAYRIISKPSDELDLYRVRYVNVPPTLESGFSANELESNTRNVASQLTININLGAIVYVPPKLELFDTKIEVMGRNQWRVSNLGNSVVILDFLTQCEEKENTSCSPKERRMLLPNRVIDLSGVKSTFTLIEGSSEKVRYLLNENGVKKIGQ